MKRPLLLAVVLLSVLADTTYSQSQGLTNEKRAVIGRFIEMTGALEMGNQMSELFVSQMSESMKAIRSDFPPEIFDIVRAVVNEIIEEELPTFSETQLVPIYDKYFSLEELEELTRFYGTDLGQKIVRTMPSVMQDSFSAGQRWGEALGPEIGARVVNRLMEEGVSLEP